MDLSTVTELYAQPRLPTWRPGDAWLGGGTWLFSEPQPDVRRLIDLTALGWPALTVGPAGLHVAATCTVAELAALDPPPQWPGARLIGECCQAFLASFKVQNVATVGGNLCAALPAGPMISLAVALDGQLELWAADGGRRQVAAADFVLGPGTTVLGPGDLLRSILLPAAALSSPVAVRRASLRTHGRSAALLIGRRDPDRLVLTVTASTRRPVVVETAARPDAAQLRAAVEAAVPPEMYHDDMHGDPDWRQHLTLRLAEQIRAELAGREAR
jgi:CO/xanthine dehydrogenase FAD-binding subunit